MKGFNQFLKESITINGDFNGTLNVGGSQPEPEQPDQFLTQEEAEKEEQEK